MPKNRLVDRLKELYVTENAQKFIVRAYRQVFGGEHGAAVLLDLQKACFSIDTTTARDSTGRVDQAEMLIREGRRQAYLHIAGMMQIAGHDFREKGPADYDHRDERREPDDGRDYEPAWPGGYDTTLDGPLKGSDGSDTPAAARDGTAGDGDAER